MSRDYSRGYNSIIDSVFRLSAHGIDNGALKKFQICFYWKSTSCFYFYRVKWYIYNTNSSASENKIIIYFAINLTSVLQ